VAYVYNELILHFFEHGHVEVEHGGVVLRHSTSHQSPVIQTVRVSKRSVDPQSDSLMITYPHDEVAFNHCDGDPAQVLQHGIALRPREHIIAIMISGSETTIDCLIISQHRPPFM